VAAPGLIANASLQYGGGAAKSGQLARFAGRAVL